MNIRAQRFATKTRTWLLIAALTALLIGIGALIGGMFLYVFVALAVLLNVVGYWFSDRIALRASRAEPVEPGANPELEGMVQDLAQRAPVPVPRLYTIASEQPNAFTTGRNPKHAAVAVTDGLLQLPREQVRGVLAHEFGHVKNRDILVSSIAAMVAGAIAASLLQLGLSRQREYLADATGAELLGRASPLAEALERRAQTEPLEVNPATASLYIVNPLRRQGIEALFSTHPPIAERVRRLRALDGATSYPVGPRQTPPRVGRAA